MSEPAEYISFPDLLDNAEDTLVKDDIEAEKPVDFGSFLEDEEAGLANLMESSKSDNADSKLDLSFVADTGEDEAGLAFLDSLDLSDEAVLEDPINSSVKDNVARTAESLEAMKAPQDVMPEVMTEHEMLDLPSFDMDAHAAPIHTSDVVETAIPEVTLVEPVIEAMVEPVVAEPKVEEVIVPEIVQEPTLSAPIASAPQMTESVEEASDADADFESEQVKLELAVAYMDFDKSLAKPLLDEVVKDGSPKQIERAQALLAQIN